jgi:hypothetical protein
MIENVQDSIAGHHSDSHTMALRTGGDAIACETQPVVVRTQQTSICAETATYLGNWARQCITWKSVEVVQ